MDIKSRKLNNKNRNYFKVYFIVNKRYNLVWHVRHVERYVSGFRKGQIKLRKDMISLTRNQAQGKLNRLYWRSDDEQTYEVGINQKELETYYGGKTDCDIKLNPDSINSYKVTVYLSDLEIVEHSVDVTQLIEKDSEMFSLF